MLTFTRISNVKKDQYDKVYAPVRSLKNPAPWMEQIKDLAPSSVLLSKYLTLKEDKNWNQETFQSIYVPEFLHGLKTNKSAIQWLNQLYKDDRAGKNIALVCFCPDETLCHRSILAGLLAGAGANIRTDGMLPPVEYYRRFMEIRL